VLTFLDGLRTIYRVEGIRGLYKGSLLALVGVSNGSIQFATYEEIKRRRTDLKRRLFESQGRKWRIEDEKLVSRDPVSSTGVCRRHDWNESGRSMEFSGAGSRRRPYLG
jgi:solute carrier family 25 folate transporter 32